MKASIRPLFRHHLAKAIIKKNILPPAKIIDIGCGRGDFSFWLVKHGYDVTAFEISEVSAQKFLAEQQVNKLTNVELRQQDFMICADNFTAAGIVCFEVLEHLADDLGALRKMRSWLAPQGLLVLSVPAHRSKWGKDDEIYGHLRRYEKDELQKIIDGAGFDVIKIYSYGFPWLNILKKVRELQVWLHPPKFHNTFDENKTITGTKHSGAGFFDSALLGLIFNPLTFYPLCLVSDLFNKLDLSEGLLVVAKRKD